VSDIFGAEEGFEGAARDLLAHSITGVTYAKKDILPGRHLVIVAAVVAVQEGVEGPGIASLALIAKLTIAVSSCA